MTGRTNRTKRPQTYDDPRRGGRAGVVSTADSGGGGGGRSRAVLDTVANDP